MFHPLIWVFWALAVTAGVTMTHNPLYLAILGGVVALQYALADAQRPQAAGWAALLRITMGLSLLVIPFNALSAHAGSHVLFRLPDNWPLIGGKITLEAVIWGATSAMGLLVLFAAFATLNLRVDQAQMLHLTPAFIYEAGLVISIALTFVPQMMLSAKEIREAQLIRGHRMRRVRDMRPLVLALLTMGLERSLQLAESMEARGFGNARPLPRARDVLYKILTLVGLGGMLGSLFALTYFPGQQWLGWLGTGASTLILLGIFWAQGKRVKRTHYRRERWSWQDSIATATTATTLGGLIATRLLDPQGLIYYPYTKLLPPFHPWIGASLILLAVPAVILTAGHPPQRAQAKGQP
jgi:energy-coupling factor transport system permease protein